MASPTQGVTADFEDETSFDELEALNSAVQQRIQSLQARIVAFESAESAATTPAAEASSAPQPMPQGPTFSKRSGCIICPDVHFQSGVSCCSRGSSGPHTPGAGAGEQVVGLAPDAAFAVLMLGGLALMSSFVGYEALSTEVGGTVKFSVALPRNACLVLATVVLSVSGVGALSAARALFTPRPTGPRGSPCVESTGSALNHLAAVPSAPEEAASGVGPSGVEAAPAAQATTTSSPPRSPSPDASRVTAPSAEGGAGAAAGAPSQSVRVMEAVQVVDVLGAANHAGEARQACEVALRVLDPAAPGIADLHAALARVCFRRVVCDGAELTKWGVPRDSVASPVPPALLGAALATPLLQHTPRGMGDADVAALLACSWIGPVLEGECPPVPGAEAVELGPVQATEWLTRGQVAADAALASAAGRHALGHKMAALIGNQLATLDGQGAVVQFAPRFKQHLVDAIQAGGEEVWTPGMAVPSSPPRDPEAYHMLGRWAHALASLSWVERSGAAALYGTLPEATAAEALGWLSRAADAPPPLRDLDSVLRFGQRVLGDTQWERSAGEPCRALLTRRVWPLNGYWLAKARLATSDRAGAKQALQEVLQELGRAPVGTAEDGYARVDAEALALELGVEVA